MRKAIAEMFKNILRPLSYLQIDHKQKWIVDWLFPFILSLVSTILLFFLRKYAVIPIYKDGAFISKVLGFVQILPGFYIAALSAIATFNKNDIDKTMPSPAPQIEATIQGRSVKLKLTRRRFLCTMFAFLTAESLALILLSIFGQSFYLPFKEIISVTYHAYCSWLFMFIFFLLFWQMLATSFWGLYYLGDRLHQPDQ